MLLLDHDRLHKTSVTQEQALSQVSAMQSEKTTIYRDTGLSDAEKIFGEVIAFIHSALPSFCGKILLFLYML